MVNRTSLSWIILQGVWGMANGFALSKPEESENRRTSVWFFASYRMASKENEQWIRYKTPNSYFKLWLQQLHPLGPRAMGPPIRCSKILPSMSNQCLFLRIYYFVFFSSSHIHFLKKVIIGSIGKWVMLHITHLSHFHPTQLMWQWPSTLVLKKN